MVDILGCFNEIILEVTFTTALKSSKRILFGRCCAIKDEHGANDNYIRVSKPGTYSTK